MEPKDSEEYCVFCAIANGWGEEAQVLSRNDELVCFSDIYPAAPCHYLVVPHQHIHSCQSLHTGHISLVHRMAEMGKAVLRDQGITDMEDIRMGFHRPPYISVNHLHLHVLAPASNISPCFEYKFIPGSIRFVDELCLRRQLKKKSFPQPAALEEAGCVNNEENNLSIHPSIPTWLPLTPTVAIKEAVKDNLGPDCWSSS